MRDAREGGAEAGDRSGAGRQQGGSRAAAAGPARRHRSRSSQLRANSGAHLTDLAARCGFKRARRQRGAGGSQLSVTRERKSATSRLGPEREGRTGKAPRGLWPQVQWDDIDARVAQESRSGRRGVFTHRRAIARARAACPAALRLRRPPQIEVQGSRYRLNTPRIAVCHGPSRPLRPVTRVLVAGLGRRLRRRCEPPRASLLKLLGAGNQANVDEQQQQRRQNVNSH